MSYSQALEKHAAMLAYIDSGRFRDQAEQRIMREIPSYPGKAICNSTYGMIENADTYWCDAAIVDLIAGTAATLPSNVTPARELLPSVNGFLWLQRAVPGGARGAGRVAFAWAYREDTDLRGIDGFDGEIRPAVWVERFMEYDDGPGFWPLVNIPWLCGVPLSEVIDPANAKPVSEVFAPTTILPRHPAEYTSRLPGAAADLRWFMCFLLFVQQRILIASQQRAERHTRKRLERDGFQHEPLVRVVELRRKQAKSEHHGDAESVEWSHQWVVSGHWRQQWYPSLNANQPRWIMPYVKGPEDKPLKPPRAKVFAVIR